MNTDTTKRKMTRHESLKKHLYEKAALMESKMRENICPTEALTDVKRSYEIFGSVLNLLKRT